MNRYEKLLFFLIVFVLFNPAWSAKPQAEIYQHPELQSILDNASEYKIAVMPIQNLTVSEEAAIVFRERAETNLQHLGYALISGPVLDRKLAEAGLTHAGQLSYITIDQLNEMVGADAYLYGLVEQAAQKHAVVYNAYAYSSSLQLYDKASTIVWSAQQERVAKRRFSLDPINALLDPILIKKGGKVSKAMKALADRIMVSFPQGPLKIEYGESLLEQAVEIEVESN